MAGPIYGSGSNQSLIIRPVAQAVATNQTFSPLQGIIESQWIQPQVTVSGVGFSGPNSAIDFRSGGSLPPGLSLTRGTTGAYIDSGGTRRFAAIDTPRFNYRSSDNGATWQNAGLLNSRSSTNYVLKSETPSSPGNSPWDFIGAPTGIGDTGADGTTQMCRFYTGTGTVQSKWAYQTISVGMGNTYRSVAVDVKPGTWPYIGLGVFQREL
jgi:hypothetical protein